MQAELNNEDYKENNTANDFLEYMLNEINELNNTPINKHRVKNTYKIKNIKV